MSRRAATVPDAISCFADRVDGAGGAGVGRGRPGAVRPSRNPRQSTAVHIETLRNGSPLQAREQRGPTVAARGRSELSHENPEIFKELHEHAPDALLIVGDTGRIECINAQAEVTFGLPRDQLVGQPVWCCRSGCGTCIRATVRVT
jgi:PAS domain-containing protein